MKNLEQLKELAAALPEVVKDNALGLVSRMGEVIEGIGDEGQEWKPSFLRLVQGTTDRSSIPKGTSIGDMVIGEKRIEGPLHFIPFRMWQGRQYWDPDPANSKLLCQSPDTKLGYVGIECRSCPFAQWVEGEGSACGKIHTVISITADLSEIFLTNYSKSGYKVGTELESLLKKAGVSPYHRTYGLSSTTSATAKNVEVFKLEVLDPTKRNTPKEYLPFLKVLFDNISSDRKEMLSAFYESAARRKQLGVTLPGLEAPASPPDTVLAVENTTTDVVEEAKVSSSAMKYKV